MVDRHSLQVVTSEPSAEIPRARDAPPIRVGLTWLDQLAATACADGEAAGLIELVRASAESLCGSDAGAARARLLAREIAIAKATLDLLVVGLGERLNGGDERGAVLLDRLATGAARRLALLTGAHTRSTVVAIAHADVVHVEAVK